MRVVARLTDVAITTFTADIGALRGHLPRGVEPSVVEGHALVSAVSFSLGRVNLWPGLRCGHVDYRAYVRHGNDDAVWFLGAAMDSRLAHVLRGAWRMPWHRARVAIANGDGGYRLVVRSADGDADVAMVADGPVGAERVAPVLDPLVGLFGSDHRLRRYEVRHGPLTPVGGRASGARIELFERFGLVRSGQPPYSMLLVPDFDIEIAFPPRRVPR